MKKGNLLYDIALIFLVSVIIVVGCNACKKETDVEPTPRHEKIGTLFITSVGNENDSFRYGISASIGKQKTFYIVGVAGETAAIELLSNTTYNVYYNDTVRNQVGEFMNILTYQTQQAETDIYDSLPATRL